MDLYWLVEQEERRVRALAVVGVEGDRREFRTLGTPAEEWPPVTGSLRLIPVRTKPLTDNVDEAVDTLAERVDAVDPTPSPLRGEH